MSINRRHCPCNFPASYEAVEKFKGDSSEIFRVKGKSGDIMSLSVMDSATDAAAQNFDTLAQDYLASIKRAFPKSSSHRIKEQQMVTLSDGTQAMAVIIVWTRAQVQSFSLVLETTVLIAPKGNKVVILSASNKNTASPGPKEILEIFKTLKFL